MTGGAGVALLAGAGREKTGVEKTDQQQQFEHGHLLVG
jgi:hypothetical protein